MSNTDRQLFALARQQGGGFTRQQVLSCGGHDVLINRRCTSGHWVRVARGVFVVAGLPPTPDSALWAAWLEVGPHAIRSHECAAEAWNFQAVPLGRLVFTSHHGDHHKVPGVTVHQLRDVLPHHSTTLGGLPTTTPERTIVDLAAVLGFERLKRVVEGAVNDGTTTDDRVGAVLHEVARPGKWGVKKLQRVIAARSPGGPVPASVLEHLLLGALRTASLPEPVPQFAHPGRHPGPGFVDFAYPAEKVILEADGRRWHQRVADVRRDRARDVEAARVGWLTMRFMHEDLRGDPDDVGASVAETLAHRRPTA